MFESLIWIVPVIILVVGARRPRAGLLIFGATLPLFAAPPGGPYLGALDVAALAAIATGLRGSVDGSRRRSTLDLTVMAMIAVAIASFLPLAYRPPSWSPDVLASLLAAFPEVERWNVLFSWRELANLLLGAGLYLAVKRSFSGHSLVSLGSALGTGVLGAMIVGFADFFGWIDLHSYRPIGLPLFDRRFHSVFFHSGWMAEYVVLATPFAAAAWFRRHDRWRLAAPVTIVLTLAAVLFSGQRGAWFTVLVQLALVALVVRSVWSSGRFRRSSLASVAALLIVVVGVVITRPDLGGSLRDRVSEAVAGLSNRTVVWRMTADMWRERPLLGWGIGSFSPVLDQEVTDESAPRQLRRGQVLGHNRHWLTAHNTYLMFLAERGLLGLVSLLAIGWLTLSTLWRERQQEDVEGRRLATGLLVSASGFAVYGLVQYLFFPRAIGFLVWLLLGATAVLAAGQRHRQAERVSKILLAAVLVLLPLRAFIWEAPPTRGELSVGFHAPERGGDMRYQWTAAKTAVRQIPWEGEILRIRLANGHPKASAKPLAVELSIDGAIVKQLTLGEGWQVVRVYVGPPTRNSVVLGVRVNRTFRPFSEYRRDPDLEDSRDLRRLGVAVGGIGWENSLETHRLPDD